MTEAAERFPIGKPVAIHTGEPRLHASSIHDQLCLTRLADGNWLLDIRAWEPLGTEEDYYDDKLGRFDVPDQIEEYNVVEIEESCVFVNNLVPILDSDPTYKFEDFLWEGFVARFGNGFSNFCQNDIRQVVEKALAAFGTPAANRSEEV